jgi:hypothetical protein
MRDWEGKLEAALRSLAESARDQTVAPSGAEIRRRAEMRRRKRTFLLPSALLTCTLAGGTAFGLTAALGHSSPHAGSARPGPSQSQAATPGHAGPATLAPGPGSGHSGPVPGRSQPAGTGAGGAGTPQLLQPLCELSKEYPYMAYVEGASAHSPAGALDIIPAACTPDPQKPGSGKLVPSGPVRHVPLATGIAIMVTAPIGHGTRPSPSTLTQLALGLQQHPGALFGVTFGKGGQVTRLTEIYINGAGGSSRSAAPPSLGSAF